MLKYNTIEPKNNIWYLKLSRLSNRLNSMRGTEDYNHEKQVKCDNILKNYSDSYRRYNNLKLSNLVPHDLKIGEEIEYQININYKHINEFKTFIMNETFLKYINENKEEWVFHKMRRLN